MVEFLKVGYQLGTRKACEVIGMNRATYYYQSQAKDQTVLRMRIKDIATSRVRYGYRRIPVLLCREGGKINRKRVYRLYHQQGLSLRHKKTKKRVSLPRAALPPASAPNERWSLDFLSDKLADGRRFRVLALVDHFSRVSPALEAELSFPGKQVVAVVERLAACGQKPKELSIDNGPEFISTALDVWAYKNSVKLCFSRPGKPTDNAYIESFNGKLRSECLDQHWFAALEEAKQALEAHRKQHNTERPHTALGYQTPAEHLAKWQTKQEQDKSQLTLQSVQ